MTTTKTNNENKESTNKTRRKTKTASLEYSKMEKENSKSIKKLPLGIRPIQFDLYQNQSLKIRKDLSQNKFNIHRSYLISLKIKKKTDLCCFKCQTPFKKNELSIEAFYKSNESKQNLDEYTCSSCKTKNYLIIDLESNEDREENLKAVEFTSIKSKKQLEFRSNLIKVLYNIFIFLCKFNKNLRDCVDCSLQQLKYDTKFTFFDINSVEDSFECIMEPSFQEPNKTRFFFKMLKLLFSNPRFSNQILVLSHEELNKKLLSKFLVSYVNNSDKNQMDFKNIDQNYYRHYEALGFIDLDGTFVGDHDSEYNKLDISAINLLRLLEQKRILKTIPCTGRPLNSVYFMMGDLGLERTAIADNGYSSFYRIKPFEDLVEVALRLEYSDLKEWMFELVQKGELFSHRCTLQRDLLGMIAYNLKQIYHLDYQPLNEYIGEKDFVDYPIVLPFTVSEPKNLQYLKDYVEVIMKDNLLFEKYKRDLQGDITFTTSGSSNMVNMHSTEYSKGKCVKSFLKALNFNPLYTFNIGNAQNDVSLIGITGSSYAMEDGLPIYRDRDSVIVKKKSSQGGFKECIKDFLISRNLLTEEQFDNLLSLC